MPVLERAGPREKETEEAQLCSQRFSPWGICQTLCRAEKLAELYKMSHGKRQKLEFVDARTARS